MYSVVFLMDFWYMHLAVLSLWQVWKRLECTDRRSLSCFQSSQDCVTDICEF